MSVTWRGSAPPVPAPVAPLGWIRVVLRGGALGVLIGTGLVVLLVLRVPERLVHGSARPWTQALPRLVSRGALRLLGLRYTLSGAPAAGAAVVVANHCSWLDIFVLNARKRVYFVSKREVADWPGIGVLARATGTVFISRRARDAKSQAALFATRLRNGDRLLFFPEGTSTDGQRVLPFKSTLFEAFFADPLRAVLQVQPVSIRYVAPKEQDPRFYAWWGDMGFGSHLLQLLAAARAGQVHLRYHAPLAVADFPDRKALARACERLVRADLMPPPQDGVD